LKEVGYWTSDDVLDSERIPESVVILGGGAIALEAATYYNGLGVETSVIQRGPQLLKEVDGDIAEALENAMRARGIRIYTNTTLSHVQMQDGRKEVCFDHAGALQVVDAHEIIYALGRKPNLDGLALEKAGLVVQKRGLQVNAQQQCEPEHIFAAGDVSGPYEVVHIAIQQGEIAARNAARLVRGDSEPLESIDYTLKLFAVFTQPEVAAVGCTAREAAECGDDFLIAKYRFDDHGKALVRGDIEGFVKLIAERGTRRIIGASAVGPEASELIHEIAVAMHFKATAGDLARVPHYHPTLSEIWTYPAEELAQL
jgi:pyruvate/2-oxoglutarate dehydrogenase complex dihydrolipoamide dehydrogenase (E3) component